MRMMLASANYNTLIAELTQLANKVMGVPVPTASKNPLNQVQQNLSNCRERFLRLQLAMCSQVPPRHSANPHCHSLTPLVNRSSTICWYHQKFGIYAKECQPPCCHSGNDPASH